MSSPTKRADPQNMGSGSGSLPDPVSCPGKKESCLSSGRKTKYSREILELMVKVRGDMRHIILKAP